MKSYENELKIQNFGAITDGYDQNNGFLKFNQNTLFCGTQGTGKSAVVKLYSTFVWLEKALLRGDFKAKDLEKGKTFVNKYLTFQNIQNYRNPGTFIHFKGRSFDFIYKNEVFSVQEHMKWAEYKRPQITYIPAERNLLSILSKDAKKSKVIPSSLLFMLGDYNEACEHIKGEVDLPVNGVKFRFDKLNDDSRVFSDKFSLKISEASSGLQSATPLFITLRYLHDKVIKGMYEQKFSQEEIEIIRERILAVLQDNNIDEITRTMLIKSLSENKNKRLISIVEEPEQNLYPDTQEKLIYELLRMSGKEENQLIMTTHSPYIINFLTLAIKAKQVYDVLKDDKNKKRLSELVPKDSMIDGESLTIYEIELDGTIKLLAPYNNMPSDENMLNSVLENTNIKFSQILDIRDDETEE